MLDLSTHGVCHARTEPCVSWRMDAETASGHPNAPVACPYLGEPRLRACKHSTTFNQARSSKIKQDQARSTKIKRDQARSNKIKQDHARSSKIKQDQVRSSRIKQDQAISTKTILNSIVQCRRPSERSQTSMNVRGTRWIRQLLHGKQLEFKQNVQWLSKVVQFLSA